VADARTGRGAGEGVILPYRPLPFLVGIDTQIGQNGTFARYESY
jgi:hypothetical protein